jgi:RNA polymerase-binding protein DksA
VAIVVDAETTERLRKALVEERESLREQLRDLGVNPDDPTSVELQFDQGSADSAQITAERHRVTSIAEGLRANLGGVEHALRRMDAGTYGTCENCGREIPLERLEAIPFARLCIDCKQRAGTR